MTPTSNEAVDINKIVTAEDLLSKLRNGNSQKLEIGLGGLKFPVRLLDATEEATLQAQGATEAVLKTPNGAKVEIFEAQITMKKILIAASTINGQGLPPRFFELIGTKELVALYDQYISLNHTINPSIQSLTQEQLLALVESVKKKEKAPSDLYTWEQAEIGRFFLEKVLPMLQTVNASGG